MHAEARADRIALDVPTRVREVLLALAEACPIAVAEDMAGPVVLVVEGARMDATQPPHTTRERLARDLQDEMEMVRHRAVREAAPPEVGHYPAEKADEAIEVLLVEEDRSPLFPREVTW